ncbi:MAG TPA: hypothetical protein VF407_24705 [Polyangiaceae bacterium]
MIPVKVSVAVGRKTVPLEQVQNQKVVSALRQASRDVGTRLAQAKCPTHGQGPTNVRLHFDASGNGDLKYDSCCAELGAVISKLV